MEKLIIDRERWLRGVMRYNDSMMLDENGYRCCLGFYAEQIDGVPDKNILMESTPVGCGITAPLKSLLRSKTDGFHSNSEVAYRAMDINDDKSISDEYREKYITDLFSMAGVKVIFTGEGSPE